MQDNMTQQHYPGTLFVKYGNSRQRTMTKLCLGFPNEHDYICLYDCREICIISKRLQNLVGKV